MRAKNQISEIHWKYVINANSTVILSFLKRERERTVNVILQSFMTVYRVQYDRFIRFTVPERYHDRS
jgi:hypothetical protein